MRIFKPTAYAPGAAYALLPATAWSQGPSNTPGYAHGPHMMGWDGGWYGMFFGPLVMILALVAVIAVAILLVRWLGGPPHAPPSHRMPPDRTPLDILEERFARGEIDKEEFEERRRVLGN